MKFRESQSSKKGFTIVEMIVAVALMAIVIVASVSIVSLLNKTSAQVESSYEYTGLLLEVSGILNHSQACSATLAGLSSVEGTKISLTKTVNPHGEIFGITAGGSYGKIHIADLYLKNITPLLGPNYRANIEISGEMGSPIFGRKTFKTLLPVYYSIDSGGKIIHCEFDNPETCSAFGGFWTGSSCDYCKNLGATRLASGVCQFPPLPVYVWQLGAWSTCSSGSQTRKVVCIEANSQAVQDDSVCILKKPSSTEACALYDWQIGSWGSCHKGRQTRQVDCIDLTKLEVTSDSDCPSSKPPDNQDCTTKLCPSGYPPISCWAAGCRKKYVCYPKQDCVQVCASACPAPDAASLATCQDGPSDCSTLKGTITSAKTCP